jgi:hypothetical protein
MYFFCVHVQFIAFNADYALVEQSAYCRFFLFGKSLISLILECSFVTYLHEIKILNLSPELVDLPLNLF